MCRIKRWPPLSAPVSRGGDGAGPRRARRSAAAPRTSRKPVRNPAALTAPPLPGRPAVGRRQQSEAARRGGPLPRRFTIPVSHADVSLSRAHQRADYRETRRSANSVYSTVNTASLPSVGGSHSSASARVTAGHGRSRQVTEGAAGHGEARALGARPLVQLHINIARHALDRHYGNRAHLVTGHGKRGRTSTLPNSRSSRLALWPNETF